MEGSGGETDGDWEMREREGDVERFGIEELVMKMEGLFSVLATQGGLILIAKVLMQTILIWPSGRTTCDQSRTNMDLSVT